jgi:hypothetical protein
MKFKCPACGKRALVIPWTFLVVSTVVAKCRACGTAYTSTLAGGLNEARRVVTALLATALGLAFVLLLVISWQLTILAVAVLLILDSAWKLFVHMKWIRRTNNAKL